MPLNVIVLTANWTAGGLGLGAVPKLKWPNGWSEHCVGRSTVEEEKRLDCDFRHLSQLPLSQQRSKTRTIRVAVGVVC
jgi:hypothetical protein